MRDLTGQTVIFSETQRFRDTGIFYLIISVIIIPVLVPVYALVFTTDLPDSEKITLYLSVIIMALFCGLIALLFWFAKLELILTKEGIFFRWFPLQKKMIFLDLKDISEFYIRQYSPIFEYGGWGIRYAFSKGWVYNISGRTGLQIIKKDNKKILFGTQKADDFFLALNSMIKK